MKLMFYKESIMNQFKTHNIAINYDIDVKRSESLNHAIHILSNTIPLPEKIPEEQHLSGISGKNWRRSLPWIKRYGTTIPGYCKSPIRKRCLPYICNCKLLHENILKETKGN